MALAINTEMASNDAAVKVGASGSLTYSFNNVAGTYIAVGASVCEAGASRTITGVTYAGDALTKFDNQAIATDADVWLGGRATTFTGANNVVATPSAGSNSMISGAISFTGQHATVPAGTPHKATATSSTPTVDQTSTTVGNIVIAYMAGGTGWTTCSGTLSCRHNIDDTHAADNGQMNRAAGNGGTVTMSGSMGGASDSWAIVCNEIIAAASGASGGGPLVHNGELVHGSLIRGGRLAA